MPIKWLLLFFISSAAFFAAGSFSFDYISYLHHGAKIKVYNAGGDGHHQEKGFVVLSVPGLDAYLYMCW